MFHFEYKANMASPFRFYEEWSSPAEIKQQKKSYMKTKTPAKC